ncbi:LOW QUALITY PROTEIN: cucumisin-like [Prosopis cineraria]|uniref:LOW QUALITY PROTEIN: cucumisin-like n=1 Tax=Prosopis cineraria TaxID=364024 RepID=UPI00240FDEBF|nr:LOW QUALITY PROTEIN: cucumisin-like [Prosopis cineraria]
MFFLSSRHLFFSLLCSLLVLQAHCDDPKTYIVYMGDHSKEMEVAELHHTSMVRRVLGRNFAPEALLHSYKKSFSGFAVRLTQEQAERMAEMDGVISVFQSKTHKLQTTRSWDFLGFPPQVKRTTVESDVIVGVIDTGISPESDSFNDHGFTSPPRKWKGSCQNITCNNKIIGAKYFRANGIFGKDDIKSPRDTDGHGTHCASTAAGNLVNSASLFGLGSGTARGGVPSARIAVYKACWSSGCESADILAAFDEAISDGVDILSVSLGQSEEKYVDFFEDVFAIGAFHAMKKGILTSKAAMNKGPELSTMTSFAPWSLDVAASAIDRKFFTKVQLGNGMVFEGISMNTFDLQNKTYPLIYSGDAPNITGGFNSSISRTCIENSLDEAMVKGKMVVCDGYSTKLTGLASGAAGIVVPAISSKDWASQFTLALPLAVLTQNDGTHIFSYLNSTRNPTATIYKSNEGKDSLSPYVASFSSRGPNMITPDILKPDISAPGVDIIAAWSPISPVSEAKGDKRLSNFNIISGTSMACPHATAAAAYVKSFHPKWSPAAIKSALMTTATPMSPALNPEAEFAYGAGQINPVKAVAPGLVYDISELDYLRFLFGQGYNTTSLRSITDDDISCKKTKNETVWDLNLPSFALKRSITESFSSVFHRTVTNVGAAGSIYKAKVIVPPSLLSIQVTPNVLSFSSVGEKKSFTVMVEGTINVGIVSASLIWDDGNFQVRSPIVVYSTQ